MNPLLIYNDVMRGCGGRFGSTDLACAGVTTGPNCDNLTTVCAPSTHVIYLHKNTYLAVKNEF